MTRRAATATETLFFCEGKRGESPSRVMKLQIEEDGEWGRAKKTTEEDKVKVPKSRWLALSSFRFAYSALNVVAIICRAAKFANEFHVKLHPQYASRYLLVGRCCSFMLFAGEIVVSHSETYSLRTVLRDEFIRKSNKNFAYKSLFHFYYR